MKKILSLVVCFSFVILGLFAQQPTATLVNENAPAFEFVTETLDYGKIDKGSDGNREFEFTNVGREPLIISNCKGSCGCTVPKCPKEPILPGEVGIIKVKYDTKRLGGFNKSITVTSNAITPKKVIKIKGQVKDVPAVNQSTNDVAPATPTQSVSPVAPESPDNE